MLLKQVWEVPREFYDLQRGQLPGVVKYSHDALWIQRLAGLVGHRQCHLVIRSHCPTVASLIVTAKADGAPFAELRVSFAQKVKLSDFLSGERTKGMFTMTGDMWASMCRGASATATAADLVASIRAEYNVDDETPLVALGLTCRSGGAPFNRVTQDDVDEESELEGHVDSE